MATATTYRVRFARGDQQFEAEGDKSFVAQMVELFTKEGNLPLPSQPSTKHEKRPQSSIESTLGKENQKPYSVSEFVHHLGVKKHTDLILAFSFFLEKYSGLEEFTAADINACYYQAKMESSNTSQMILQNVRKGFFSGTNRLGGGKRYSLTEAGKKRVEALLQS